MNKRAVDVVLLPSKEMMGEAIRLSGEIGKRFSGGFVLNEVDCLPHISLAMGSIAEEEIPAVRPLLEEIASRFVPIETPVLGLQVGTLPNGKSVSTLRLETTPLLQLLHETVMNRVLPLMTHDALPEWFAPPFPIEPGAVDWVNRYPEEASFERFSPHMTLGLGRLEEAVSLPARCRSSRLALCHLGNHCTCRRILIDLPLAGNER